MSDQSQMASTSPAESVKSATSTTSIPSAIPTAAASHIPTAMSSSASSMHGDGRAKVAIPTAKPSGIKPPSAMRIGRPCMGHDHIPKAGPPPLADMKDDNTTTMRRQSDEYSRSHLSDHSIVLTSDTDSFIIGQRIWVGGIRPGHIAYIGETHFAPGDWAGVVLDDPNGKNDGCVAGKRYFQCEPKRGIFSRLTRLTREPIAGATSSSDISMNVSTFSVTSPSRSGTVSPTHSMKSFSNLGKTPSKGNLAVGDRVIVSSGLGSRAGILKYIGETKFASGNWCGVQLDDPSGKNDGTVDGDKYFECPPNYGIFVPLAKVTLSPSSRKTRLSRSGSKESLTSVNTVGTIASTATSRLRMSAQRQSSSAKPITTPKNTFSLQDILREKQNHIEQLLIERDLEKQDTGSQILNYQKDIHQLKERIVTLEQRLSKEKRKAEDLQSSIDEATFCGDELNAQTQDYKERIIKLEAQLTESNAGSISIASNSKVDEVNQLQDELNKLQNELTTKSTELQQTQLEREKYASDLAAYQDRMKESESDFNIKLSGLGVSEQCLREEIKYMTSEIEQLKQELRTKDETTEKEYLNMKHIENELKEDLATVQNELEIQKASLASNDGALQILIRERDTKIGHLTKQIEDTNESLRNVQDQSMSDLENLKNMLDVSNSTNQRITNEQTNLNTEIEQHKQKFADLQKSLENSSGLVVQLQNELSQKAVEQEVNQKTINMQQQQIETLILESKSTKEEVVKWEVKHKDLESTNLNLSVSVIAEKEQAITALNDKLTDLNEQHTNVMNDKTSLENDLLGRDRQLEENEILINELQSNFKEINAINVNLQAELLASKESSNVNSETIVKLNNELRKLNDSMCGQQLDIDRLQTDGASKDERNRDLQTRNEELAKEIDAFKQIQELDLVAAAELKAKLLATDESNLESNVKITDLSQEIEQLKSQIEALSKEIAQLQQTLSTTTRALDTSKMHDEESQNVINELTHQTERLKEDISCKVSEIEKVQKQVLDVTDKLAITNSDGILIQENLSKLEVEHEDIKRKMVMLEQKCEQITQEKTSLQHNLDALQCSSSDINTEIRRLTEELQLKQKTYEDMVDKSNSAQLALERKLHEQTQNLAARTTQWERVKDEIEILTTQKIDRENELNLELAKIKEVSEGERESLANEINALRASFKDEKDRLLKEIEEKLLESTGLRTEMNENISKMEVVIETLRQDIQVSRNEIQIKDSELTERAKQLVSVENELRNELDATKENEKLLKTVLENTEKSGEEGHKQLATQLMEKENLLQNLSQSIGELQTQLEETQSTSQALVMKIESISSEREIEKKSFEAKFIEQKTIATDLENKLAEITNLFKITEDDQVDLVNKNLEMVETIQLVKQQLSESEERHQSTKETLLKTCAEFEAFQIASEDLKSELENSVQKSNDITAVKDEAIGSMEEQLKQLYTNIESSTKQLENMENTLKSHQEEFAKYKLEIQVVQTENDNKHITQLAEKDKLIGSLEERINQLTSSVNLSDDLKNELNNKSEQLRNKDTDIAELNIAMETLKQQVQSRDKDLQQLLDERQLDSKKSLDDLQSKTAEINHLQEKVELLERSLQQQSDQTLQSIEEKTGILGEKDMLAKENESLNRLVKQQQEEFQGRMVMYEEKSKFDAVKEELAQLEEVKRQEVSELMEKLARVETDIRGQQTSMDRLDSLQRKEKELQYEKVALERREKELTLENKQLTEKLMSLKVQNTSSEKSNTLVRSHVDDQSDGQISFLNSIIADMQKKNENLTHRIQALEAGPADFVNNGLFDVPVRRQPTPRLFCDICDEFDAHDTEDCPLQSSDSPPTHVLTAASAIPIATGDGTLKERKLPPPRLYCESCEAFGHSTAECDNEETY